MKTATLNKQGRVVIPQEIRDEFNFKPGDKLVFRNENGKLIIENINAVHERIWAFFKGTPDEPLWSDELIAERREEARKERAEMEADDFRRAS
jgi:AbrB family looped-hinge helix DNA binding protein